MANRCEARPFGIYYGTRGAGCTVIAGNYTTGRRFQLLMPCKLMGVEFWNPIVGAPTIKAGIFLGATELTSVVVPACPVGLITARFAAPYIVTWAELATQYWGDGSHCYSACIWDTSGVNHTTGNNTTAAVTYTNRWPLGVCYCPNSNTYDCFKQGPGWVAPTGPTGINQLPIDPLIVPTMPTDGYEVTPRSNLYGLYRPAVPLHGSAPQLGAAARTVGGSTLIKKIGVTVYGVRFYTCDPNPWTARCAIWEPRTPYAVLGQGDVACTGPGIYDALFAAAYVAPQNKIGDQCNNAVHAFGVYNLTNTNYTYCNMGGFDLLYGGNSSDAHYPSVNDTPYSSLYAVGFAGPWLNGDNVPVDLLVEA